MFTRTLTTARQLSRIAVMMLMLSATGITLGACNDDRMKDIAGPARFINDDDEGDADLVYDQVEFLGNPLVSEVTIAKANHDAYNRTQPYNTATFGPQSLAFINAFRGDQPVVANTLGAVLYPDMLIVESSRNPATAGWLSWALAAGWGGRNLADDVVDAGLSAIFGKIVSATGAYCDNFTLPLCTDNVGVNDKTFGNAFPYLASPTQ
jgi:hypothetical protein